MQRLVQVTVLLFVLPCVSRACAEQLGDAQDRGPGWYAQVGAYVHWLSSNDFEGPPLFGGLEYHTGDGWSGGLSLFNNSFGQFTQYLYVGRRFHLWDSRPEIRLNITAGIVHGYRDEFYDTLPIRWGGDWGLGFVPAIGYQKRRMGFDVALLGVSGLLFLVGYQL